MPHDLRPAGRVELVSVITPCCNAAPFVAETIESVKGQTYPHIEHIVIDDGSVDASWEVIEQYAKRVTALRLQQNRGGSYARNRGVELARGEFLMFLDADDLIAPATIEALVEAARQQPGSIAICDCKRWRKQPDGRWAESPRERPVPDPGTDLFKAYLTMSAWPPPCCILWPRHTYELTGGWDEELARDQDTDILLRAHARGSQLVRAQGGVGYYRLVEDAGVSVSSGISLARYHASIRVLDKLTAELVSRGQHHLYATLLSRAYHQKALFGFRAGFWEDARGALRKGEALGRHVASTRLGARVLERLLGMERKERVVQFLMGLGLTTANRRDIARRKRISSTPDVPFVGT
jgi:glycosyltransferase involved in cell wall biosynthesis